MTWEELLARQQKEIAVYEEHHRQLWDQLRKDQEYIRKYCTPAKAKAAALLDVVLLEQQEKSQKIMEDERDALLDAHEKEQSDFLQKARRNEITDSFLRDPDKRKDRGR